MIDIIGQPITVGSRVLYCRVGQTLAIGTVESITINVVTLQGVKTKFNKHEIFSIQELLPIYPEFFI